MEGRALHADEVGSLGNVPGEAPDLDRQIFTLEILARLAQRRPHQGCDPAISAELTAENFFGKHFGFDLFELFAGGEDNGALDDIAKLADIAGPVVSLKRRHRFLADGRRTDTLFRRVMGEKRVRQRRYIVAPLRERRHLDWNDIQAVEQIFAKPFLRHFLFEITGRRGNNPHIHPDLARAPYPHEALFSQHPQNAGLGRKRHVRHLVEIERTAVGHLEQSGSHKLTVRFFAEQLFLEPLRSYACRVHDDERLVGARAPTMQQARSHLLSGTGRTADEYAAASIGNTLQSGSHRIDRRRIPGEFAILDHTFA